MKPERGNFIKKKIPSRALAVFLIVIMLMYMSVNTALTYAGDEKVRDKAEVDGITYNLEFYTESKTAKLKGIDNPETATAVNIPSKIEYEGEEYTLTELSLTGAWSQSDKCPNITSLTIPSTVTSVSDSCRFNALVGLEEITIPGSVGKFGGSFQNCNNLKSIIFEEGVKEISSNMMVYGANNLSSISLPSTLEKISGPGAFKNATGLTSINLPEGVTITENSVFGGCTSLKEIELPASVTSIPASTFGGCTSLTSVTAKGTITSIGGSAFSECSKLSTIPELSKVTQMGKYAFNKCYELSCDIDLSSLDEIPDYAFNSTSVNLTKLSSSLKSIGAYAFVWSATSELELPDTVKSIGSYAFYGSDNLKGTVKLPDSLTELGASAFGKTSISEVEIGSALTEMKDKVFSYMDSLEKITFDNSEENIRNKQYLPSSDKVEIVYLVKSIGDVGDTISDEIGSQTLQEAVNASTPGSTIRIKKDIKLSETLVIPAGKDLTLTCDEGYTIIADKSANLKNLINVEEGAKIAFAGELKLSGTNNSGSIINSLGEVTIKDNTNISRGNPSGHGKGCIVVSGETAALTINGGLIEKNTVSDQESGVVLASNGATVQMNGGKISGNKVDGSNNFNSSSGIFLTSGAKGTMTGGEISGNTARRGSAVMIYEISEKGTRCKFDISGGLISDNTCVDGTLAGSGAVHIEGNSEVTMTGGKISGNRGVMGAGVCAVDYGLQKGTQELGAAFILDGGEISGNTGRTGAGIYSFTNGVKLLSGKITGNVASNHGGGVYSEGNKDCYSSIYVENVSVTENKAEQGGGLWFCPTGSAEMGVTNGLAIFDNKASGAGDDLVAAGFSNKWTVTLPERLASGEKIDWYEDGAISRPPSTSYLPTVVTSAPRYGDEGANKTPQTVKNSSDAIALKVVTDSEAVKSAHNNAKLIISGNEAAHGGGIAANGGVIINEKGTKSLIVRKEWKDGGDPKGFAEKKPESVEITLVIGDKQLDSVVLSERNNWQASFTGLSEDLPLDKISVVEKNVPGFSVTYSKPVEVDGEINIVATNTYDPTPEPGNLQVSKTVAGNGGSTTKDFTFTVTLDNKFVSGTYGDMVFKNGTASFTLKHGESKTAVGLPDKVGYTVTESDNEGYAVQINGTTSNIAKGIIASEKTAKAAFVNIKSDDAKSISVSKQWVDSNPKDRPQSVSVQLYRDGVAYGSKIKLNDANNWMYTWTGLDVTSNWTVDELDVPEGYRSEIKSEGNSWIITNYENEENPNEEAPPTGTEEDNPPKTDKDKPDNEEASNPFSPETGDRTNIMLWIITLISASLAGGIMISKRKH